MPEKKHKHCFECKGCYGYHYPGCICAEPDVDYRSIEEVYLGEISALRNLLCQCEDYISSIVDDHALSPWTGDKVEELLETIQEYE